MVSMGMIINTMKYTLKKLKNHIIPGALILMYHRVAESNSDPWGLCVTPKYFADHLEVLRAYAHPLHLHHLTHKLENRRSINRSIVITFDDGYADNFYNAKSALEKYDIPATVFVTAGSINQKCEFWWDELDRILLQPGTLPPDLTLKLNGQRYEWFLNQVASYSEVDYIKYRYWNALQENAPSDRHRIYRQLYELLYPLSAEARNTVLDQLRNWAGMTLSIRPTHRTLSPAELSALGEHELIEIGAHTLTHPFLSTLPAAQQKIEIQQSKTYLETLLKKPVNSFSYPHGDYTEETISIVKDTGFHCACSSLTGNVYRRSDRFLLPRVEVQNWTGDQFTKWLSGWISI
jgi:peptidoglycan/xylan/chitin deacetylase (PgdA/CDA1 family)